MTVPHDDAKESYFEEKNTIFVWTFHLWQSVTVFNKRKD